LRQAGWEAGIGQLEALVHERENIDQRIEDLYRQLHEIGYFSDGKGGGYSLTAGMILMTIGPRSRT
tara:strand:- start:23 stop:220 length:198 start_codon:yes stop_codon:yes gene_type:complete